MVYLSPLLNILSKSVRDIGKKLVRDFNEVENLQSSVKGTTKFADETYKRIKKSLITILGELKPKYEIILSNTNTENTSFKNAWFIDPIDGFTNFSHGVPHFSISVCVVENSTITTSVIYDPIKDEMFYSFKGKGAYLNDSRIRVSSRNKFDDSLLSINIDSNQTKNKIENKLINKFISVRQTGCESLDLCYVACGRYELHLSNNVNQFNLLFYKLIIEESGGTIIEKSDKYDVFIASNNSYKNSVQEIINKT